MDLISTKIGQNPSFRDTGLRQPAIEVDTVVFVVIFLTHYDDSKIYWCVSGFSVVIENAP